MDGLGFRGIDVGGGRRTPSAGQTHRQRHIFARGGALAGDRRRAAPTVTNSRLELREKAARQSSNLRLRAPASGATGNRHPSLSRRRNQQPSNRLEGPSVMSDARLTSSSGYVVDVAGRQLPDILPGQTQYRRMRHRQRRRGAGKTIGRYSRIAGGQFVLDGTNYDLLKRRAEPCTAVPTAQNGLDARLKRWHERRVRLAEPRPRSGFPGNMECRVRYTWSADNTLRIDYTATGSPTVLNLITILFQSGRKPDSHVAITNSKSRLRHTRFLDALIPTGEIVPVPNTSDFQTTAARRRKFDRNALRQDRTRAMQLKMVDPRQGAPSRGNDATRDAAIPGSRARSRSKLTLCRCAAPSEPEHRLRPGETFRSATVYGFGVVVSIARFGRGPGRQDNKRTRRLRGPAGLGLEEESKRNLAPDEPLPEPNPVHQHDDRGDHERNVRAKIGFPTGRSGRRSSRARRPVDATYAEA